MGTWRLAALGLVTHCVLLYSVLEVYYSSPLTHGMRQYGTGEAPPARRVVLFVADGLRADTLFRCRPDGSSAAPFIRNMSKLGAWGTADARVPTETRPGHLALIAGIYEDVSAITRGWQENPVQFDSVFNQSRYTWSWGNPDLLHMFSKVASGQHVFTVSYESEYEFHKEGWPLDIWVLDRFREFMKAASTNSTLDRMLREDRIVFFLHLVGIDTTGHAFKPASKQYEANLELVDQGVQEVCQLLDHFYGGDQRTAYVFTSDHGMTDWGSHGAGSAQETCIPLVAWGAGIRRGAGQALQCWPAIGSPTVQQVSEWPPQFVL